MRPLKIEEWISTHEKLLSDVSKILLNESILAYKAGAYRAAFIMSWLAFLNIVKERLLLIKSPPSNLNKEEWDGIKKSLQKEDEWDKTVYNLLKKGDNTPFKLPDETKLAIKYWKEVRNACAHGKTDIVSYYHIETFWAFIEDFVDKKMKIVGEVEGFVEEVIIFYEAFGTRSEEFQNFVQNLFSRISQRSIEEFLDSLWNYFNMNFEEYKAKLEFFDILSVFLKLTPERIEVHQKMIDYIITKLEVEEFILYDPDTIIYFEVNIEGILPNLIKKIKERDITINKFKIFLRLLSLPYISESTKKQLSENIASSILSSRTLARLDTILKEKEGKYKHFYILLKKYDFFKHIREVILNKVLTPDAGFGFANSRVGLVLWYLKNFDLDKEIVKHIIDTFPSSYSPHPFDVARGLKTYFQNNPNEWTKFCKIAKQELEVQDEILSSLIVAP